MTKVWLAITALVFMTVALGAQTPSRFRFERPVQPGASGPNRLQVDVPLLTGARANLSDLRLFTSSGQEVPYLLIAPPPTAEAWLPGAVLAIAPVKDDQKETSGFEADFQQPVRIDRVRVEGIPAPFLKRAVVEGSGDRERWTLLDPEATLFDLPMERLRHLQLQFPAGDYRYVRVTWNDANSGRVPLPRSVQGRVVPDSDTRPPSLTASVPFEERPSEPQRSRYRLQLPGANLPIVGFAIDVDGPYVMRQASITESKFDGRQLQPEVIGSATLKRVTRDGVQADELVVRLGSAPRESQLELVIDDGSNGPLVITAITAIFAELPTIYFESDGTPLIARYGSPRLDAPRYDLEAARNSVRLATAAPAQWGERTSNTTVEPSLESPLPAAGATLDPALFTYSRELPAGTAGLMAVPLDAAVLSHSSSVGTGFADVRIVNSRGAQIPYLVEFLDEPLTLEMPFTPTEAPAGSVSKPGESWYRIELPYDRLPSMRLVLNTNAKVFRRRVSLMRPPSQRPNQRSLNYQAVSFDEWAHASEDVTAPALTFEIPGNTDRELFVVIFEGDNTRLPLTRMQLLLPSYRLRFFRPEGDALRLVYGREGLAPPEYDLELLAPQVLGAAATELQAGSETVSPNASGYQDTLVPPAVFWAILAVAIAVLLGIIVRLVRAETPRASSEA